jgi:DNA gyrase subunit A
MIVTKDGMIIRQPVNKISIIGRNTQGVRLIALNNKDKVYDITRIIAEEEQEEVDGLDELSDQVPEDNIQEDPDSHVVIDEPVIEETEEKTEEETVEVEENEVTKTPDAEADKEIELDFGLDN